MNEITRIETEEGAVPKPRRARVTDAPPNPEVSRVSDAPPPEAAPEASLPEAAARKRDYLAGFLAQEPRPAEPAAAEPGGDLYEAVIAALKDIYDPEIPVNIYDLGLIYGVEINEDSHARITMTLTTPHCPVAESMPGEIELRVGAVPGIGDAIVELVWDPPWSPDKMTDEARLELGML